MSTNKKRLKNSRKAPCDLCGVKTGSSHNKNCKWAFAPRLKNRKKIPKIYSYEELKTFITLGTKILVKDEGVPIFKGKVTGIDQRYITFDGNIFLGEYYFYEIV